MSSTFSNPLTEYTPQMETLDVTSMTPEADLERVFTADQEMDLAVRLLAVGNDDELEAFLGDLIRGAAKALGSIVKSPIGEAIGGVLKTVARSALPIAGGALGTMVGGPLGAQIGSGLASVASQGLGLELEGLSAEDQEFEATRQFVRFAAGTVRHALETEGGAPVELAREAARLSAQRYAPGLAFGPATAGSSSTNALAASRHAHGSPVDPTNTRYRRDAMHDIDRTQVGQGYEMDAGSSSEGADYGESEQAALAAELMELETEEEFENFLGDLLRRAASAVGGYISSQTGRSLGSLLKGAARQILPVVSQALGPESGGSGEYEGGYDAGESEMEEQEWEAATTFVKLAEEAAKIAAQTPPDAEPDAVAGNAVAQAAQVHAPALVGPPERPMPPQYRPGFPPRMGPYGRRSTGRWIRRGNQILLLGV